jgi:hypothetical protein
MKLKWLLISVVGLLYLSVSPCRASDAYLIEFLRISGKQAGCEQAVWSSVTLLYNRGDTPAVITFLDMANGSLASTKPRSFSIPSHRAVDLIRTVGWEPEPSPTYQPTWLLHIDIPPNVTIENRNEVTKADICEPSGTRSRVAAKVSIPIVRQLAEAGIPQVFLGTDVVTYNSRENVMIYNAGAQAATARIEVRRACDDLIMDSGTATISPRSLVQIGSFTTGPAGICSGVSLIEDYVRYTVVTLDQPGFAVVSTLTEQQTPSFSNVVPLIELNVAINGVF